MSTRLRKNYIFAVCTVTDVATLTRGIAFDSFVAQNEFCLGSDYPRKLYGDSDPEGSRIANEFEDDYDRPST